MIRQLEISQTQVPLLCHRINCSSVFQDICKHVKRGIPACSHIAWDVGDWPSLFSKDVVPCGQEFGRGVNDLECELPKLCDMFIKVCFRFILMYRP